MIGRPAFLSFRVRMAGLSPPPASPGSSPSAGSSPPPHSRCSAVADCLLAGGLVARLGRPR
eukprot:1960926-Pyramimonas_sp.AAC.1